MALPSRPNWSSHAVSRFAERYGGGVDGECIAAIVPRIETRYREMFSGARYATHGFRSRVRIKIHVWSNAKNCLQKVFLIYDHRARLVVTALPPEPANSKRLRRILTLRV